MILMWCVEDDLSSPTDALPACPKCDMFLSRYVAVPTRHIGITLRGPGVEAGPGGRVGQHEDDVGVGEGSRDGCGRWTSSSCYEIFNFVLQFGHRCILIFTIHFKLHKIVVQNLHFFTDEQHRPLLRIFASLCTAPFSEYYCEYWCN